MGLAHAFFSQIFEYRKVVELRSAFSDALTNEFVT